MMTRTPEHSISFGLRTRKVLATASLLALAACTSEGKTSDAITDIYGCVPTDASRKDAQTLRPELAGALAQVVDIYNDASQAKPLRYSTYKQTYIDVRTVPVPGEQAHVRVEVRSSQPTLSIDSIRQIDTSVVDSQTNLDRMGQFIEKDAKNGWSFSTNYLTEYSNDQQYSYTSYEATPGDYGCAWKTENKSDRVVSRGAYMERNPRDAHAIANEAAARMLVLVGTMQHLTPGATEFAIPQISSQFYDASRSTPPSVVAVK